MLIECPDCERPYHIGRGDLGEGGRVVICPRCEARWFLSRDADNSDAPHIDLVSDSFSGRTDTIANAWHPEVRTSLLHRFKPAMVSCLMVALAVGALGARVSIVRAAPRAAALYALVGLPVNVRGLELNHIAPERSNDAGVKIAGEIRNIAQGRVRVPRLAYQARGESGSILMSWSEAPPAKTLAAGGTLAFVSAPHDLPPESRTVLVRFENDDSPAADLVTRATR